MTQIAQRFVINLELVVTEADCACFDEDDIEDFIKDEIREAWQGVHGLDLEALYVHSVEETATEAGALVLRAAQRSISAIAGLRAERTTEPPSR